MELRLTRSLAAAVLASLLMAAIFCRAQQPADSQAQPQTNAPQTATPAPTSQPENPSSTAPGEDKKPPSEKPEGQIAPEGNQPPAPNDSTPAPQQNPELQAPAPAASKPASSPKQGKSAHPKKSKGATSRSKTTAPTPSGEPGKVVVRNGGARDDVVRLSPGGTREQELHTRENTSQLLATTDENLKRLAGRQLTTAEQSTVDQIHSYMRQSKLATDSGDLARAHTLAFKAHLLSDDLAKR